MKYLIVIAFCISLTGSFCNEIKATEADWSGGNSGGGSGNGSGGKGN